MERWFLGSFEKPLSRIRNTSWFVLFFYFLLKAEQSELSRPAVFWVGRREPADSGAICDNCPG